MNSLMEMRIDQIRNFLDLMDRLTTRALLSRQVQRWGNPLERHAVTKTTFAMPDRWELVLDKVEDIHPDFFNQIWKR